MPFHVVQTQYLSQRRLVRDLPRARSRKLRQGSKAVEVVAARCANDLRFQLSRRPLLIAIASESHYKSLLSSRRGVAGVVVVLLPVASSFPATSVVNISGDGLPCPRHPPQRFKNSHFGVGLGGPRGQNPVESRPDLLNLMFSLKQVLVADFDLLPTSFSRPIGASGRANDSG